jgi:hypothetical protein
MPMERNAQEVGGGFLNLLIPINGGLFPLDAKKHSKPLTFKLLFLI